MIICVSLPTWNFSTHSRELNRQFFKNTFQFSPEVMELPCLSGSISGLKSRADR